MATGEGKNKWNGNIEPDLVQNGSEWGDLTLSYTGKKPESQILEWQPGTFQSVWSWSDHSVNQLYYGENLDVLAYLGKAHEVMGKVRLVYIDPPFATNKVYKSRTRTDAYHDLLGGVGYLEFLRERLVWLREILADDGSIYVHLDSNMIFHAKLIMDEIFGRRGFKNLIVRRKSNPKNYTKKVYGNVSDYILFYTKSENFVWNRPYQEWTLSNPRLVFAKRKACRIVSTILVNQLGLKCVDHRGDIGKQAISGDPLLEMFPKALDQIHIGRVRGQPDDNDAVLEQAQKSLHVF